MSEQLPLPTIESQPVKQQSLVHIGTTTRDALDTLARAKGTRWQDLCRTVLKDYLASQS